MTFKSREKQTHEFFYDDEQRILTITTKSKRHKRTVVLRDVVLDGYTVQGDSSCTLEVSASGVAFIDK